MPVKVNLQLYLFPMIVVLESLLTFFSRFLGQKESPPIQQKIDHNISDCVYHMKEKV